MEIGSFGGVGYGIKAKANISVSSSLSQISHCTLYIMCCVGGREGDEGTGEINDDLRDS